MTYFRRPLSGVQSQPPGGRVFSSAMGALGAIPQPAITVVARRRRKRRRRALGAVEGPAWYRQMQGSTLGDDGTATASSLTEPTLSDTQFRSQALTALQAMRAQDADRIRKEEVRGYLQLAATLSIPLAAFLWKRILGRKKSEATTT